MELILNPMEIEKKSFEIITERLKKVMEKLIHPLQGAFVPNQSIQDNVLIAHEILHSFRGRKGKDGSTKADKQ